MHSLDLLPPAAADDYYGGRLTTAGICWALNGREATRAIVIRSVNLEGEPNSEFHDNVIFFLIFVAFRL
jgi:hypothetical protein